MRSIRFGRADSGPGGTLAGLVFLDTQSAPVGRIVRWADAWAYELMQSGEAVLSSALSRQDLERQVMLYHFGSLPSLYPAATEPPDFQIAI